MSSSRVFLYGTFQVTADATRSSSPLQLSKSVSFNGDPARAEGTPQLSAFQLQGIGGPQLHGATSPARRGGSSLSPGNLRGMTPPASRAPLPASIPPGGSVATTKSGGVLDDESTINSLTATTARDSNAGSSYSKAMMQKWVPPVYYSSKNKVPVAEVGAIPYQQKRLSHSGALRSAGTLTAEGSLSQAELDELVPVNRPNSRGLAEILATQPRISDGNHPLLSKGFVGGFNNSAGRSRQDSLGAAPPPAGEQGMRREASRESEQVLRVAQR
jgi:hypothetical protein